MALHPSLRYSEDTQRMLRYIALVWDPANSKAQEDVRPLRDRLESDSPTWTRALSCPGLAVYCTGTVPGMNEIYPLHDHGGAVLGSLFARSANTSTRCTSNIFQESQTKAVLASRMEVLITRYWGSYIAFIQHPAASNTWILRSPLGTLPCFWANSGDVRAYFSDLQDGFNLGLIPTPLIHNWTHVARLLAHPGAAPSGQTGLKQVFELLGGECHEWYRGQAKQLFLWNPLLISDTDVIENEDDAVQTLRRDALDVVLAVVTGHPAILHTLSGFDSSMVAALIHAAESKPEITYLNYYSPGLPGHTPSRLRSDERRYASATATHLGNNLITHLRDGPRRLDQVLQVFPEPTPENDFYYLASANAEARYAHGNHATAITSGFGGDQLFCQSRALAARDYAARHRMSKQLLRIAFDEARLEQQSFWRTLFDAFSTSIRSSRWVPHEDMSQCSSLLRRDVLHELRRTANQDTHPLLLREAGDNRRLWKCVGKLHQIQHILKPPRAHNPFGASDHPPYLAPLYAQPLAQTCLRIPNYVHTARGWDRNVARRAIRNDLPGEVITRRAKGGFEDDAAKALVDNREFARQVVHNCEPLTRVINLRAFDAAVSRAPSGARISNIEIYDCIFTAAWAINIENLGSGAQNHAPIVPTRLGGNHPEHPKYCGA
jgi:asparagine synthase (glutamine-hydrolysing)